ncbi:MAG: hypothetical protein M3342_21910 [Bacteroidota bacterium]|nr:hypothetical protein [Bacteroidota bacterium]
MSFQQEEEFLQTQIATALEGGVLVAKQLKGAVEQKTGCKVSNDYVRDLSTGMAGVRKPLVRSILRQWK